MLTKPDLGLYEYCNAHSVKRIAACLCVFLCFLCFSGTAAALINAGAPPTLSSTLTPAAVCSRGTFNYVPASNTPNVGFTWTRPAVPGIAGPAKSGVGAITDSLVNTTSSPVTVAYQYTLTAGGVSNTQTVTVVVNPLPVTSFTTSNTEECLTGNDFTFTSTSTVGAGSIIQSYWYPGDGSKFNQPSLNHVYTTPGSYVVTLICVSSLGCIKQTSQTVIVDPAPVADFTYSPLAPYTGDAYQFNNTSVDGDASITNYAWNFGDGGSSSATDPTHAYTPPGTYTVSLTATDAKGCTATTTEKLTTPAAGASGILDFLVGSSPAANNTAGLCLGSTFYFTDSSIAAAPNTITGNSWNFGDGSAVVTLPTASHLYSTAGTYIVVEMVTFSNGTSASVSRSVNVYPAPGSLTLLPATNQVLCPGTVAAPVYFQPAGDGLSFSWTVSNTAVGAQDGSGNNFISFTAANNTNLPLQATVTVKAASPYGCVIGGNTFNITVNPQPAMTSSIVPQSACSGTTLTFPPFSSTIPGSTFQWFNTNPVTGLAANGTGDISFTGVTYTAGPTIAFISVAPVSNKCAGLPQSIAYTIYPVPALDSPFAGLSVCSGTPFDYTPATQTTGTTFTWTRAAETGIQQPAASGSNNIAETLTNQTTATIVVPYQYQLNTTACANTQTVSVRVLPTPALSSTLTPPGLCNGTAFAYTPTSATAGTIFSWNRAAVSGITNPTGSGAGPINETLQSTVFTAVPVTYQYTLNDSGCVNTQNVTVVINPVPTIALPAVDSQSVCAGAGSVPVSFTVDPLGTPVTWTNSNPAIGLPGTGASDTLSFLATNSGAAPISGSVQGIAQTAAGCTSTPSGNYVFTINPLPVTVIDTPSGTLLCLGAPLPLAGSGGNTFQWSLNGTPIAGATNPNLSTAAPGNYTLTAFNTLACFDTAGVTLSYIPKPQAAFVYNKSCLDTPIALINTSNEAGGIPVSYTWSDGGQNTSTTASPTFVYNTAGKYSISLVVTPEGCTSLADTVVQSIDITAPLPGERLPAVFIEANAPTQISGRSFDGAAYVWAPGAGLSTTNVSDPLATLTTAQEYNIAMTFLSGCVTTDTLQVQISPKDIVYIPNAFTPNGDGKNDLFVIAGLLSYPGSSLAVYDRWGKQVFFASGYENNWTGGNLQNGTYIYVLELKIPDGPPRIKKGFVEIIR